MSDDGIITKIVDSLSGEVVGTILNKLKEKTSSSKIAVNIKEKFRSDHLHEEFKKLINESIVLSNKNLKLNNKIIKENINNNRRAICACENIN